MKVFVVFGTRPEAIKLAPVILALRKQPEFETCICITAQHRQMLDPVLKLFGIKPDYDLNLMQEDQSLFHVTARALAGLESILNREKPDAVLVQGDTTSTFAAALAAYYLKISVGHIEAGLRTSDKFNPFPEEINRRLTDALSDFCFAPTERARQNLLREGIPAEKIFVTGNTIVDALQYSLQVNRFASWQVQVKDKISKTCKLADLQTCKLILVTGHRRESFGPELESICHGLKKIAERYEDVRIIYPVHLNPNVRKSVHKILKNVERVHLVEPLEYMEFIWLLSRSYLVLTDSGGVQEEAPALGKPVLILRKKTERPEGIEAGVAKLVGTDSETIFQETQRLLEDEAAYARMAKIACPYGDGHAAERIVRIIKNGLKSKV